MGMWRVSIEVPVRALTEVAVYANSAEQAFTRAIERVRSDPERFEWNMPDKKGLCATLRAGGGEVDTVDTYRVDEGPNDGKDGSGNA